MEIWIHSIGWDTNFISLNPVNLNPLLNAGLLFVGCAIFPITFLIHPFLPKPTSILSLYPECLCSLCYGAVCVPWALLSLLTCGNEEEIKIRSCLKTKKFLEKLCVLLLAAAFMAEELLWTIFVDELWEIVTFALDVEALAQQIFGGIQCQTCNPSTYPMFFRRVQGIFQYKKITTLSV